MGGNELADETGDDTGSGCGSSEPQVNVLAKELAFDTKSEMTVSELGITDALEVTEQEPPEVMDSIERLVFKAVEQMLLRFFYLRPLQYKRMKA